MTQLNMTNDEYKKYSDSHMPRSQTLRNMFRAFWVGGLICCIGQLLSDLYTSVGLNKTDAASAVSITLVFLGVAHGLGAV